MKTSIKFQKADTISTATQEQMWSIYKDYYTYSKEYFLARIPRNTHFAIFLHGEKIIGFTGLRINQVKVNGKKTLLLYFGQAVIQARYRGKNLLRRLSVMIGRKYFWDLLLSDGYVWSDTISFKSYLFFAKSMAEFYPTYQAGTPSKEADVIRNIGQHFYPDSFCLETGTVHKSCNYVSDPSARITRRHLSSADIRFYAEANQGHPQGDGLITIAPMSFKNLFHIIHNMLHKQWAKFKRKHVKKSWIFGHILQQPKLN